MNLKKYYPFVFPTLSLILVLILAFRWYNLRTQREELTTEEPIQIQNLTEEEQAIVKGVEDVASTELTGEASASGQVRFSVKEDRLLLSVQADLPELTEGNYQVWLKGKDQVEFKKAFVLDYGKAGYTGSAAVGVEIAPVSVKVSREMIDDDKIEQEILSGLVEINN